MQQIPGDFSVIGIILGQLCNNNTFLGGFVIIFTLDHT